MENNAAFGVQLYAIKHIFCNAIFSILSKNIEIDALK